MNTEIHKNDPLYGVTLEKILITLEREYGWQVLGTDIPIKCFIKEPSIKSSLIFLRRTSWARKKVEDLYIETINRNKIRTTK